MDEARFEEIYRLYATDVLRFSYFYLGSREQAEDVTQDTFVKLLTSCPPDLAPQALKTWLLKVARNRCRDTWRTSWARRVIVGSPMLELIPEKDGITDTDAARIGEIVMEQTGLRAEQIKIIEAE